MPIDLAQPRVLAFRDRDQLFTLTCKPITKEMWLKYFASIESTSTVKGGETTSTFDSTGAKLDLLTAALTGATGYTSESDPITSHEGWREQLPIAHRRAAAELLVAVQAVPNTHDAFELGFETVTLQATWTEDGKGGMQSFAGLKHVFSSPTAEHQKRYSRAMSRSVVTGGRNGTTRWLGAQDVLIEIYDELIVRTEGYEGSAVDVVSGMDCYHKVAAATALFAPLELDAQ